MRADRLAAVCERRARWWGVLLRWVFSPACDLRLVFGAALIDAIQHEQSSARFWRQVAQEFFRRYPPRRDVGAGSWNVIGTRQPEWAPDFGERRIHPTAGICCIGARMPLIAYNINLDTPDIEVANKIAHAIRASSGGFKYCKAIGVKLEERNIAQVSMNLVNYEGTPIYYVFEMVRALADRYGARIIGSELVGLTPGKALFDCAEYYLKLENFDARRQVMEYHLIGME